MSRAFCLSELAERTHARLVGDASWQIRGVEALECATSEDASFLANPRYREAMTRSQAGVICVDSETPLLTGKNYLICQQPSRAFQILVELFLTSEYNRSGFVDIHPTAVIHPSATLGAGVQIAPYVVIDHGVHIGDHTHIGPHTSIGPGVLIGTHCKLYAHITIRERCTIGHRVVLQPGVVVGSCGFGFTTDASGKHTKLEQLGSVHIEDDVEVGANTTIDRARFKTTRIGRGTKIDNLVQIAHNVRIGPDNIIVAQTGIAGSVKTGKNVVFGGQAGVVGHIEITDGTMIATRGGVSKSVPTPGKYSGSPIMSLSEYNRNQVHLRRIGTYVKQIEELEQRIRALEQASPRERQP